MVDLYGKSYKRLDLEKRTGDIQQFASVQAGEFVNGTERGIRYLEFRTGTGLQFRVLIDRAMDIGTLEYQGTPIGWHSPTGFRHPGLHEHNDEEGHSWLRSMSGFMLSCGLDHTLKPECVSSEHYVHDGRKAINHALHGRLANIPAKLIGYGGYWSDDEYVLWCEGEVTQATVFGENLKLIRRIESRAGEYSFVINDKVVNMGFYKTPHMYMYHINIGFPLLDEGTEFIAPISNMKWASHADRLAYQRVGYLVQPAPETEFHEQVYEHCVSSDSSGKVPVAAINPYFNNNTGLGLLIEFNKQQFPCLFQWQNMQEGLYTLGIEPSTNHIFGENYARKHGELRWLNHNEEYNYNTKFTILQNKSSIGKAKARISSIQKQPPEKYPVIEYD